MEVSEQEVRDGYTWLVVAGAIAIVFSISLQYADFWLTTSDREVKLEQTLYELRTAQHFVGAGLADRRRDSSPASRHSAGTSSNTASHDSHTPEEQVLVEKGSEHESEPEHEDG